MPATEKLSRALHARFGQDVADDFVRWFNAAETARIVLPRPSKRVRDLLGEDVVDELMDLIIAVRRRPPA